MFGGMKRKEAIGQALSVLKPQYLKITNESHLHAGHEGSPGSGESHFAIIIKAESMLEKSLLQQHRLINELLKDEFEKGLHALSIKILH